jgi:predicted nucleotidyltransferase
MERDSRTRRSPPPGGRTARRDHLAASRDRHASSLEHELAGAIGHLSARPDVQLVVLFGSYAAGRKDLFTDLDLLVVMRSSLGFVERTARLYADLRPRVDMDLLVYTPEELDRCRHRPFIRRILQEGKVLYEKESQNGGQALAGSGG